MLRPFRIRDLHQEPTRQNLYDAETESSPSLVQPNLSDLSTPNTSRHGTVHLSAPEYDDIVTSHPRAVLTYMDEDDGEVITVSLKEYPAKWSFIHFVDCEWLIIFAL